MVENDIKKLLNKESIVKLYFKDIKITPKNYSTWYCHEGLEGITLRINYITIEDPTTQKVVLTQMDRENLLAKTLLRIEKALFLIKS